MAIPKFPELEEGILKDWDEKDIFKKTLAKPSPKGNFVFFEGPPTANGKPGIHHLIARYFKDVILRYKTMQGFYVERKAGWDTHGLPVEIEVEKKLGFKNKRDIEDYGIAAFNKKCRESVWEYKQAFTEFTHRSGYWLDLDHPYITYDPNYMETLWWIVKKVNDRGFLYEANRVVPHCPRCGTTLSSHELAQGYAEVEDVSVYVRFKILDKRFPNASFLVWTTTPWTLPSNVALALGEKISYSLIELAGGERLLLATDRLGVVEEEFKKISEHSGAELAGISYEPLYSFVVYAEKSHYTALADFVSTTDGSGIVHIAPMYGADDFTLGAKLNLPEKHLINERGEFMEAVKPWAGMFVKKADPLIIEDLKASGKLYKTEKIKHEYPFCWRCKTPLIYYAKPCWYFKTTAVAEEMIKANETITWVPDHIKEGRFGEWLKGVKDWALTRERYWATPLPIWKCAAGHATVVGSYDELNEKRAAPPARLLLMRHGEAESNLAGRVSSGEESRNDHLIEKGKKSAKAAAKKFGKEKVAAIYASPYMRTKETAEIIAEVLGLPVVFDDRLREINSGAMDGKTLEEFYAAFPEPAERWTNAPNGGENFSEVRKRMMDFIREINVKHAGETVLVVGHGDPLYVLDCLLNRVPAGELKDWRYPEFARPFEVFLPNWPFNDDGALDPHRPFIDEVKIKCAECGELATRIKDVMDVWFDSGSMPFAEWHYPFENKDRIDKGVSFPADYISEGIDQTRGWFYTLLAVSSLLGYGAPYKNVITMNMVLDKNGFKMSKSKGNIVEPQKIFSTFGSDALRFYFFSINQPGDYKKYDDKDVDAVIKKVFLILWNTMEFWKMSRGARDEQWTMNNERNAADKEHILDAWLRSRIGMLTKTVTEELEKYHPTEASRALAEFVNELSTWYVRRSRDRLRSGAGTEPLKDALMTVAKLLAPFTPFIAEGLYRELGGELSAQGGPASGRESIHLCDWPEYKEKEIDAELLEDMEKVRKIVELGHSLRDDAQVKLRQPLAEFEIEKFTLKNNDALLPVIAEELNVKSVRASEKIEERQGWLVKTMSNFTAALRTEITTELRREGMIREILRQVNDLRKEAGLTVSDRIKLFFEVDDVTLKSVLTTEKEHLAMGARADEVIFEPSDSKFFRELEFEGAKVTIKILKI
jgi:isoleucyl-tRNA synthetase